MHCLFAACLIYFTTASSIANYFLWSANTQAFYNYAWNDLHAVNGLSSLNTLNDVAISEMGAFFASNAASRIRLPPNNLVPYQYAIGTSFSMIFWVNPSNLLGTLVEKYDSSTLTVLLGVKLSSSSLQVTIMGQSMSGALGLTANTWQMVTVVFSCAGNCVVYAYRNLGEFSFSKSFTTTFTDNTAKSFFLGFSPSTTATGDYVGYMSEFIFLTGVLTSTQLPNFLAYAGTTQCPFATCNDLCSVNIYTPARCLRTTALVVNLCVNNCNSMDCAWFTDQHCFNVFTSCHPTCLTCLDGVQSYNCDSCNDSTDIRSYGSCLCHDGYYRNTNTWLCTLCDPTCLTCVTGTNTGCMTCKPNATLGATLGPAACPCNAGYYFETTTAQCTLCYKDCATCSTGTASGCTACKAHAQLAGATPNTCVCFSNYYYSTSSISCLPCDSTCKTCTGGSSNMCTACFAGAAVNGSGSCVCATGYFPNLTASSCSACDLTCLNCNGTASNNCISCLANASLSLGTCHCTTGFYPAPTSAACTACDPTCTACNIGGSTHCTGCYSNAVLVSPPESQCACIVGYYPSSTAASCLACDLNCAKCAGAGPSQCTSCKGSTVLLAPPVSTCGCNSGYYQGTSYDCNLCDLSCGTCVGAGANMCKSCKTSAGLTAPPQSTCVCNTGFYPNPGVDICTACDLTCKTCSAGDIKSCLSCKSNASLNGLTLGPCTCLAGYYPNHTSALCSLCDLTCVECVGPTPLDCTVCCANASLSPVSGPSSCLCNPGYYLVTWTSRARSLQTSVQGSKCVTCDQACSTCNQALLCLTCKSAKAVPSPVQGCDCNAGYFPNLTGANCSPCDPTCRSCLTISTYSCTDCFAGAALAGPNPSQCLCIVGYYPASDARSCALCDATCLTCNAGDALSCSACFTHAELKSPPLSECICSIGYYPNLKSNSCSICDPTCQSCVGPTNLDCATCKPSASLATGASVGSCVCNSGFYGLGDNCQPCDITCLTCSGGLASSCISCKPNAQLSASVPSSCICISHYFPSSAADNCLPCNATCQACVNPTTSGCTACYANANLSGGVGSTSDCQCISHYFPSPDVSACSICDPSCQLCTGPVATECTACYPGAQLQTAASPSQCVCLPGLFPLPIASNCTPCATNCGNCVGPSDSDCTSCKSNATLAKAALASNCACNPGYYGPAGNCVPCDARCVECSGPGSQCTLCYNHAHLAPGAPGDCLCDSGYFPSADASNCVICDATCLSCSGPGPSSCASCFSNASFVATAPKSCICSSGFYGSPDSSNCAPCDVSCLTCVGSTAAQCTTCVLGASVATPPGLCTCPSGQYLNTVNRDCEICDSTCAQCIAAGISKCTQCISPAVLGGPSPNICVCTAGFYSSASGCQPCISACQTCSGPGAQCLTCPSSFVLETAAPSNCVCPAGFFLDVSGKVCNACAPLCVKCVSAAVDQCSSCKTNARLIAGNPSECRCQASATLSPDGTQCLLCDSSCASCSSSLTTGCLTCKDNSALAGPAPAACQCISGFAKETSTGACVQMRCQGGCATCSSTGKCESCYLSATPAPDGNSCVCKGGFYPDPDPTRCQACSPDCLACASGSTSGCTLCKANAVLSATPPPSMCVCGDKFFPAPDASNCKACPSLCAKCSDSSTCTHCPGQYFLANRTCLQCATGCQTCSDASYCNSCGDGLFLTTGKQCVECADCKTLFYANATGPIGNDYNITFSRPVSKRFTKEDFNITSIPGSPLAWDLPYDRTIRVAGGPWANITALLIQFVTAVVDDFSTPLSNPVLTVSPPLDPVETVPFNQTPINTTITTTATVTAAVVSGSAIIIGASTGGGSLAMALLSQMQYFSYIGTTNYSMTGTMNSFYTSLNQKSTIPNFFKRDSTGQISARRRLDSIEQLITVKDFLDSSGQYLTLLGGIFALHLVAFALSRTLGHKCAFLKKLNAQFVWSVYLYFWYFAYLDLQVSAFLQMKNSGFSPDGNRELVCVVLAILVLISTVATPFFLFFFIKKYSDQLLSAEETPKKAHFSPLVSSLRKDVRWAKYLVPVYYFQRLIYTLFIVYMRGRPLYQSLTLIVPCGIMVAFVILTRPMVLKSVRVLHIIAEIDSLIVYVLLCFSTLQYNAPQIDICWIIVGFTLKSFLCTVLMSVIEMIKSIRDACRKRKSISKVYAITTESINRTDTHHAWADQTDLSFGEKLPRNVTNKIFPFIGGKQLETEKGDNDSAFETRRSIRDP